jgi:hypothetical protein
MMMLGLIGEYLGRTYLSANRQPQSIVREVRQSDPARRTAGTVRLSPTAHGLSALDLAKRGNPL